MASKEFIDLALEAHNVYRKKHGQPLLEFNQVQQSLWIFHDKKLFKENVLYNSSAKNVINSILINIIMYY